LGCVTKKRAKQFCEMKTLLSIPTLRRYWQSTGTGVPYYGIHDLKVGDRWWTDNPPPTRFKQHYVSIRGLETGAENSERRPVVYKEDIARGVQYIPAEAAIARELLAQGAEWAIFSDCFTHGRTFVQPDLKCVEPQGELAAMLDRLRAATSRPNLGGLPDVIAKLDTGMIAFREAKYVTKNYRDAWGPKQENMASAAMKLWPGNIDIAIVEWGAE
jgi:hypothetical protein